MLSCKPPKAEELCSQVPNSISQSTRRKIMDFFSIIDSWSGKLDEPDFLARIYDLTKMKSTDPRYKDAYGDIKQHRVNNFDWEEDWVFTDPRFNLLHAPDSELIQFLNETLSPKVRDSDEAARLAKELNKLLRPEGYEFGIEDTIGDQHIYRASPTNGLTKRGDVVDAKPVVRRKNTGSPENEQPTLPSTEPHHISRAVSTPGGAPVTTPGGLSKAVVTPSGTDPGLQNIFIVHGHDTAAKDAVHLFLLRLTGKDAIIMHEQGNEGQSLMNKLETSAATASYAVVLLTADDEGKAKNDADFSPRGRQNVVFEMGYFMGKLGVKKVAVLYEAGVEEPGDVRGMVYISYNATYGTEWKAKLAGELIKAGFDVDLRVLTK